VIDQRQGRYFEMQQRRSPGACFFIPLADLYRRLGRLEEAQRLLVDGLRRHPDSTSGRVVLALVEAQRGQPAEARRIWERVLSSDPEHAFARRELAALSAARQQTTPSRGTAARSQVPAPVSPEPAARPEPGAPSPSPATEEATEAAAEETAEEAGPAATRAAPVPDEVATAPAPGPEISGEEAPAPGREDLPEVFLTGTLADIYLRQGHRHKALQILRRVLSRHPEREDVARRIAELEGQREEDRS